MSKVIKHTIKENGDRVFTADEWSEYMKHIEELSAKAEKYDEIALGILADSFGHICLNDLVKKNNELQFENRQLTFSNSQLKRKLEQEKGFRGTDLVETLQAHNDELNNKLDELYSENERIYLVYKENIDKLQAENEDLKAENEKLKNGIKALMYLQGITNPFNELTTNLLENKEVKAMLEVVENDKSGISA